MPQRPLKPCRHPGCGELTREGYCNKHKQQSKKVADERRGNANSRGYNYKWQRYRAGFLQKHPLCAECEKQGRVTPATIVDHIIPHKGDTKLFWDKKNHQPLCKRCHDIKTAREDGGYGNKIR
jgi:5-methylcytosine-specific restriction protein A